MRSGSRIQTVLFMVGLLVPLSSAVFALDGVQGAVEWRIEDGGNGHWYAYIGQATVDGRGLHWLTAHEQAIAIGGELASIESELENAFVFENIASNPSLWFSHPSRQQARGPWIGLYASSAEWVWSDQSTYSYANWAPGEPYEGVVGYVRYFSYLGREVPNLTWDNNQAGDLGDFAIIEWDADCNGDGSTDIGQILNGELSDFDSNGIPDLCEQCPADLSGDGELDFFDISGFVLYFQLHDPIADLNSDGDFDFLDISAFLSSFSKGCP